MKLCRFRLLEQPEAVRSGVLHEGKVYETDGVNAIGVHEISAVRLLNPIGQPPNLRLMSGDGDYRYANTFGLLGPDDPITPPLGAATLELKARFAVVVKDLTDPEEDEVSAASLLGYTMVVEPLSPNDAWDLPLAIGPVLHTVEEFGELGAFKVELLINQQPVAEVVQPLLMTPHQALQIACRTNVVAPGDVIALPAFDLPLRPAQPGDVAMIRIEKVGALALHIA